ncbi:hypothetical protein Ctaglu_08420 [Clostridium tagluense]|uniref:Uncharacterized protein n=1 Tax=Clostridium tagluense TaxID=360422 RepID=A0A401UID0_9CLOT|nr:hypothetical protein Ctaglu_08420 [Clostridium tagluense]
MNKSTISKNYNTNLGGITTGFAFFENKNLLSRYRRKPLYLCNNSLSNDLYYFLILNKRI